MWFALASALALPPNARLGNTWEREQRIHYLARVACEELEQMDHRGTEQEQADIEDEGVRRCGWDWEE